MEMGEVDHLVFKFGGCHIYENPMSCTPGCFDGITVSPKANCVAEVMIGSIGEEAAKIRAALPPGHGHVVFDTSLLPSTFRTLLRALGNQCKIYIHTDSPPTAEWGIKVWGKQWQEPRWGILDTLD